MKTRHKLMLVLAFLAVAVALLAVVLGARSARGLAFGRAAQAAEQLRAEVLLHAVYAVNVVVARQNTDSTREGEVSNLLRTGLNSVEKGAQYLSRGGGPDRLPPATDPSIRGSCDEFLQLWANYRDALRDVLDGRSVLRNRDFALSASIELANRVAEIARAYERKGAQALSASRNWLIGLVLLTLSGALAAAALLRKGFLTPLDRIAERLRLMSSGRLPLGTRIPNEEGGEVADLGRQLDLLVERLGEADRTKDRFLATMSHEIRTPLNGVIGFLGNLETTELNEQQQQYVRIIDSSARALLHVINEILDFSKLKAGKMELELVAFDLATLLRETIAVTRQMAHRRTVKVVLDLAEDDGVEVIRGDPTRLRQVLGNLLSNAVKFTEEGEVRLAATCEPLHEGRVAVSFAVSDTGVGIAPSAQRRLFEAFSQAETSTTRKFGGTGLGLCIAADLVSLMGGKLTVESRIGDGTRFTFRVEVDRARPEEQVQLSPHYTIKLPPGALKKHWALLVDDTPTNLFLLETICQNIGLPYMTAVNGQEAVDKVRQFKFDLVFMDIQMPVMDGYTAIRRIRELENGQAAQIIALTASAMQEDIEKALGAGSTGFMAKPFERNQLLLCIAEHLGIPAERELRPIHSTHESPQELTVRRMYDYMREKYQISLGEIKLVLAQSVANWRPHLDDLGVFGKKGNWEAVRPIAHQLKGQLAAIGLPEFADMADEMTRGIRDRNVEGLTALIERFVAELGAVFKAAERGVTLDQHAR